MEKSDGGPSVKSREGYSSSRTRSAKKVKRKSSASSRREKLVVVNVKNMKKLPPLTDDQRKQLAYIDSLPDDQIDFSDIPEMEFKGPVYVGLIPGPGRKTSVTIRLDSDMVEWFKAQGKGWQTKMNWALRLYFASHRKTGAIVGRP